MLSPFSSHGLPAIAELLVYIRFLFVKTVNNYNDSTFPYVSVSNFSNKYGRTMHPERVCATVITAGRYNSCLHLRSTGSCMFIFYLQSPDGAATGNMILSQLLIIN